MAQIITPIVVDEAKHAHTLPIVTRLDIDGTLYELHDGQLDGELTTLASALHNTQVAVNDLSDQLDSVSAKTDTAYSIAVTAQETANSKADKISYALEIPNTKITKLYLDLSGNGYALGADTEELTASDVNANKLTKYDESDSGSLTTQLSYIGTANESFISDNDTYTTHDIMVYLLKKVNTISGVDPELLASLEKIIAELEGNSENEAANAWITLVDKLKGLGDESVKQYVDRITSSLYVDLSNEFGYSYVKNYNIEYNTDNTTLAFSHSLVKVATVTNGNVWTFRAEYNEQ